MAIMTGLLFATFGLGRYLLGKIEKRIGKKNFSSGCRPPSAVWERILALMTMTFMLSPAFLLVYKSWSAHLDPKKPAVHPRMMIL
jgi:hypothetical protein